MSVRVRPNSQDHVLATDLDGTFIPLAEHPQNRQDLRRLAELIREYSIPLVFVTGRHLASVQGVRSEHNLPRPDWIICDVGTTIYQLNEHDQPQEVAAYREHLEERIAAFPLAQLRESLADLSGLRLQEQEKQGRFKLSYYTEARVLDDLVSEIERRLAEHAAPYSLISSIDPFNGDGLIDLLPKDVSKAYALHWWSDYAQLPHSSVVFAGDTGNDIAALTAGFCAIVVANADRKVARDVYDGLLTQQEVKNRLFLAQAPATSGVLEGCLWFQLFSEEESLPSSSSRGDYPWGATPLSSQHTHFKVWAPKRTSVAVEIRREDGFQVHPLTPDENGDFSGTITGARPLDRYRYLLDDSLSRPDPVSRYQPDGVHGDSMIIDPNSFPWSDQGWKGVAKQDLVIYELHIGALTTEGTFLSAIPRLKELKELGITAVEVMPVAQTPGRWNWGYDGVNLFAVRNTYGSPDDFKAFIDACHAQGLAVILDVVYNHVGPEGNYWADFAPYYSTKHHTPWGDAFAFDGPDASTVRRFVVENALFWLREYHLDGLRLDAVHCMYDDSPVHILEEIREAVAEFRADEKRHIHLIAESNRYDPALRPPQPDRPAYDALWCDDIMHSIYSVITPETNVTHRIYSGPSDLAESLEHGFIYQGPPQMRMNDELRAHLADDPVNAFRTSFVIAVQNHDNIGNHPHGLRIHQLTSPAHQKAAAALVLLYPAIPLLFMGEEHASSAPFRFFVDFEDDWLRRAVEQGRAEEYPHQIWEGVIPPTDERAFRESQIDRSDDPTMFGWYQSLFALRKEWQTSGLVDPHCLKTFWEPEARVFGITYSQADRRVFVLSRLYPETESPATIQVHIEGKLLLDSASENPPGSEEPIEITTPRALIGEGAILGF